MHIVRPALMAAGVNVSRLTLCRISLDAARRDGRNYREFPPGCTPRCTFRWKTTTEQI